MVVLLQVGQEDKTQALTLVRSIHKPTQYIPANIRLAEDVQKTSARRLQCNIFLSSKTSWRPFRYWRLEDIYVLKTSWRSLQEVLEDERCYAEDVLENKKCLLGYMVAHLQQNPTINFHVFRKCFIYIQQLAV